MTDNERWYDEHIALELLRLANECGERGMAFLAQVEYEPGSLGLTAKLGEGAGLAMNMLWLCAQSGDNVDRFMMALTRFCQEKGIGVSNSIYLSGFGRATEKV